MPGRMKKINGYRVTWGGRTVAKRTTKRKGQAQLNLLRAKEHGWRPTGKKARYKRKRKSVRRTKRRG